MILLQANQIARFFGAEVLFEQLYMEIQDNSRIALVGRNGAGKSTLLKIIAEIETPDAGHISKTKDLTIGYLDQHTGLDSEETVWNELLKSFEETLIMEKRLHSLELLIADPDTLADPKRYEQVLKEYDQLQHDFQQINGYGYEAEIKSILNGFHFDETYYTRPINSLSGGQKTRLALAKLLLERPNLLILDEPTNHLDIETLTWLETYLQNYRGALLMVSHDRYFLDKIVTEVYELSRHKLHHYKGNYSFYLEEKAERLTRAWKEYDKQQDQIQKLEDFVAKNIVRASTTKRAQSRRKQLEKMDRIEKPLGDEKSAKFQFKTSKQSGNVVLQVEGSSIGYTSDVVLSKPVDLDIRKQEAIALVGPNGVGKSTLLKSIMGDIPFLEGQAKLGTNVSIGYYDQEQADLHSTKTVLSELWDEHPTTPEKDIRSILGSFLFTGDDVQKTVPLLSGGEKARLALAKLSMNQDNFLILDEPTNHLDIDSKEVLENALIEFDGTILFVSHDRYFINRIATKVVELTPEGSTMYLGDYDYFIEKKKETALLEELTKQETTKQDVPTVSNKSDFQQSKDFQRQLRQLSRRIEAIENRLQEIEQEIEQLQLNMTEPTVLNDHVALIELDQKVSQLETEQLTLMEEWEEKSLELEEMNP